MRMHFFSFSLSIRLSDGARSLVLMSRCEVGRGSVFLFLSQLTDGTFQIENEHLVFIDCYDKSIELQCKQRKEMKYLAVVILL